VMAPWALADLQRPARCGHEGVWYVFVCCGWCARGGVQGHMVLTKEEQRIVSRGKKKAAAAIECIRALSAKMTGKVDIPIHNDQRQHEEHEEHEEHEMCGSAPSSSASRSASAVSSTGERGRAGAAANSERTKQTSWRGGQW
jgi:hypothetical protein